MDSVYPEPMSLLHRRVVPRKRKGASSRYRTQPVTFLEIQEVDEDNLDETSSSEPTTSRSELSILNSKFDEFKRSRDLMLSKCDTSDENFSEHGNPPLTKNRERERGERATAKNKQNRPSI